MDEMGRCKHCQIVAEKKKKARKGEEERKSYDEVTQERDYLG